MSEAEQNAMSIKRKLTVKIINVGVQKCLILHYYSAHTGLARTLANSTSEPICICVSRDHGDFFGASLELMDATVLLNQRKVYRGPSCDSSIGELCTISVRKKSPWPRDIFQMMAIRSTYVS